MVVCHLTGLYIDVRHVSFLRMCLWGWRFHPHPALPCAPPSNDNEAMYVSLLEVAALPKKPMCHQRRCKTPPPPSATSFSKALVIFLMATFSPVLLFLAEQTTP